MARHKGTMPTIWEVDDELWHLIKPIIDADMPRKRTGRPPADRRTVLNCIIHRMRSGCQWNQLPNSLGSDRTAHRYFQRWANNGVLRRIWKKLTQACDELGGVDWRWQSADGAMGKARFGGIKWARTQQIAAKTG
jgi:putative transposase